MANTIMSLGAAKGDRRWSVGAGDRESKDCHFLERRDPLTLPISLPEAAGA